MKAAPLIPALTGARLVACLLVVVDHGLLVVPFAGPEFAWQYQAGVNIGFFGMSLFFVLSGFVIYLNYAPQFQTRPFAEATLDFAVARFARLYPLYAFFMLLVLASVKSVRIPAMFPDLLWWIPLMQSWVLGSGKIPVLLAVEEAALTWSISTEVFFYAVFPVLCLFVFKALRWRTHVRLEMPLLSVCALLVVYGAYLAMPALEAWGQPISNREVLLWLAYWSPYCQLFAFLGGVTAARLYLELQSRPVGRREARIAAWGAVGAVAFLPIGLFVAPIGRWGTDFFGAFVHFNLWNLPASVFLVFYLARYDSALGRLLSGRLAVGGGEASYSIYLFHLWVVVRVTGSESVFSTSTALEWLARFAIYVLFTFAVACGTYRLIEMPSRRWIRQAYARLRSRKSNPAPVTASGLAND